MEKRLMGIATGLNGFYISTSRLMFAQGRAHFLPDFFSRLHPKHRTPAGGITASPSTVMPTPPSVLRTTSPVP